MIHVIRKNYSPEILKSNLAAYMSRGLGWARTWASPTSDMADYHSDWVDQQSKLVCVNNQSSERVEADHCQLVLN